MARAAVRRPVATGVYDGHGSRYVDDVRAWQTDEPALELTGAAIIAAAARLRLRPHAQVRTPVSGAP